MKKKIILILSICALLILAFAISASATNVIYIEECDSCENSYAPAFPKTIFSAQNDLGFAIESNMSSCHEEYYLFNQEAFIEYVDGRSYDVFHKSSEDAIDQGLTGDFVSLHSTLSEDAFNYLVNYVPLTQEDLTAEYNKGLEEGKLLGYEEGKFDAEAAAKAESEDDEESSFSIGAVISAILILCPVGLVTALIISKRRKSRR